MGVFSERIDLTGNRYGRLTVIGYAGPRAYKKTTAATWLVRCDCGNERVHTTSNIKYGHITSCGCARHEAAGRAAAKRIGVLHPKWKGGRTVCKKRGYVYIAASLVREKYPHVAIKRRKMSEHIAVMSEHLGRPLHENETVHHKNGIRSDNSIDNLELRVGNHGPGQSIPDMVEWASEMLRRYAPDRLATRYAHRLPYTAA